MTHTFLVKIPVDVTALRTHLILVTRGKRGRRQLAVGLDSDQGRVSEIGTVLRV